MEKLQGILRYTYGVTPFFGAAIPILFHVREPSPELYQPRKLETLRVDWKASYVQQSNGLDG